MTFEHHHVWAVAIGAALFVFTLRFVKGFVNPLLSAVGITFPTVS